MDGLELAHYVRNRWPPTVVVISSGRISPQRGALADDVAFLAKPYDDAVLQHVLQDVKAKLDAM